MPGFTTSFLFPDINVWVALTHGGHVHHLVARDWLQSLDTDVRFCFCRFTQLGLLRLLTAEGVMGDEVLNQVEAWAVYDRWQEDERVTFLEEPQTLERRFRSRTRMKQAAPKVWADAYLAAFAEAAQVTLVTFDRAFRGRLKPVVVLEAEE
jgi:toxin-antitoxin system PIN domain toxin